MADRQACEAKRPGCERLATDVHHVAPGRPEVRYLCGRCSQSEILRPPAPITEEETTS